LQIDEHLVQKTLKNLRTDSMDETLLDELQSKVRHFFVTLNKYN